MKKRFIAGAQCPACDEMDTLVLAETAEGKYFECVDCGFSETMNSIQNAANNKSSAKLDNLIQWVSIDTDAE